MFRRRLANDAFAVMRKTCVRPKRLNTNTDASSAHADNEAGSSNALQMAGKDAKNEANRDCHASCR